MRGAGFIERTTTLIELSASADFRPKAISIPDEYFDCNNHEIRATSIRDRQDCVIWYQSCVPSGSVNPGLSQKTGPPCNPRFETSAWFPLIPDSPPMHPFLAHLMESWPPSRWSQRVVVVAVSGGADSVALAHGLVALRAQLPKWEIERGKLVLAHFNHRLREKESDKDQWFVEQLAERLECESMIEAAPSGWQNQSREGLGAEGAARTLRYAFLRRVSTSVEARYVVTAHHRDDQVETVLLRLFRGTGVGGLVGMAASRELSPGIGLVRPLLGISRAEIRDYLHAANVEFCEDLSNNDPRYTRNRMRNRVLPLLRKEFGNEVDQSIARLASLAGECQEFIQDQAEQLLTESLVSRGDLQVVLQFPACPSPSPFLMRETLIQIWREMAWPLRDMTHEHWRKLAELVATGMPGEKLMLPGKVEAQKKGEQLSLARLP